MSKKDPLTREHIVCPECGETRIRAGDSMICPNGHGRSWPRFTADELRKFQRREAQEHRKRLTAAFPKARRALWVVDGLGRAEWWAWATMEDTPETTRPGFVLATVGERVAVFKLLDPVRVPGSAKKGG